MSYEKQTWVTGDVITADKLNHMEDGIEAGSSVTVFPIVYEGSDGYVEVESSELMDAMKSGVVIFREVYEENGAVVEVTDYYVMKASSSNATSVFLFNNNATVAGWSYNNGRYEGPNY